MKKVENDSFFKKGIWIKEQQGNLTIGSLDKNDTSVKIISDDLKKTLNASLMDNHFCMIYRDSTCVSHPSKLKKEIHYIQIILKGEMVYKAIDSEKSYFDIMIPSGE
ncbi:MAG: hypothetical protein ABIJ59_19315 [Pseudomonadota bacterium]